MFVFDSQQMYDNNPFFFYNLIISATSPSYQVTSITATFEVVATDISSTIQTTDYIYGKNSALVFDIVENGGNPGLLGEIMDLYYSGQKYSSTIQSDGTVSFNLTFFEVGSVSVIVGYNSVNDYPYNPINQTVTLNLDKAKLSDALRARSVWRPPSLEAAQLPRMERCPG